MKKDTAGNEDLREMIFTIRGKQVMIDSDLALLFNVTTKALNQAVKRNLNAELFQKGKSTINEHILNVFKEGELEKESTIRKIGISDFSTKPTNCYNPDVNLSVGYRLRSHRGNVQNLHISGY
ncbi:MAG: ORF6N domain-containing protein [Balneolaceae bacterium]